LLHKENITHLFIKNYLIMENLQTEIKKSKSSRGFAAMDPQKQREIASKGGKASHQSGNAHEFSSEEARAAGRKGGESRGKNRQMSSRNN
jgi:general stress protein YciG